MVGLQQQQRPQRHYLDERQQATLAQIDALRREEHEYCCHAYRLCMSDDSADSDEQYYYRAEDCNSGTTPRGKSLISSQERQSVMTYLVDMTEFCRFQPETPLIALNLFDRFLETSQAKHWLKKKKASLSLVYFTCMYLALSWREPGVVSLEAFLVLGRGKFTAENLQAMQALVATALQGKLQPPTVLSAVALLLDLLPFQWVTNATKEQLMLFAKQQAFTIYADVTQVCQRPSELALRTIESFFACRYLGATGDHSSQASAATLVEFLSQYVRNQRRGRMGGPSRAHSDPNLLSDSSCGKSARRGGLASSKPGSNRCLRDVMLTSKSSLPRLTRKSSGRVLLEDGRKNASTGNLNYDHHGTSASSSVLQMQNAVWSPKRTSKSPNRLSKNSSMRRLLSVTTSSSPKQQRSKLTFRQMGENSLVLCTEEVAETTTTDTYSMQSSMVSHSSRRSIQSSCRSVSSRGHLSVTSASSFEWTAMDGMKMEVDDTLKDTQRMEL